MCLALCILKMHYILLVTLAKATFFFLLYCALIIIGHNRLKAVAKAVAAVYVTHNEGERERERERERKNA